MRCSKLLADDLGRRTHRIRVMIDQVAQVPAFETARLRLRRLTIEDAPSAHKAYGDSEAMKFWDMPPSSDLRTPNAAYSDHFRSTRNGMPPGQYWPGPMASFPTTSGSSA